MIHCIAMYFIEKSIWPQKLMALIVVFVIGFASGFIFKDPYYVERQFFKWFWGPPGIEEMFRTTSPDGVVDAIVIRINPGAMSSYIYQIHIVPRGGNWKETSPGPIFQANRMRDEKVSWRENHFLEIYYRKAHITFFANVWYSSYVQNSEYYVELRLKPTSEHPAYLAPEGSLDN